jgi:hypothetical protein
MREMRDSHYFGSEKLKRTDSLEILDVDGRIILKLILEIPAVRA